MLTLLALPLALLSQQQGIAQRLAGRVSPNVAALVEQLATAGAARGLPRDPLIQKAIEGGAKSIPDDRVAAAVRRVAVPVGIAAAARREGATARGTPAVA